MTHPPPWNHTRRPSSCSGGVNESAGRSSTSIGSTAQVVFGVPIAPISSAYPTRRVSTASGGASFFDAWMASLIWAATGSSGTCTPWRLVPSGWASAQRNAGVRGSPGTIPNGREGAMPGVAVVSVPVTDQDKAAAFYNEHLGFHTIADVEMGPGMRWLQLGWNDQPTSLTLVTWFDRMPAGSVEGLVIDVDAPDACQAKLVAAGVECSDVGDEPWGRAFTCRDPDGNGLVVARLASRS